MMNDLDLIIKQYQEDINTLHVYAIGDVHVGSPQYNDEVIRRKIQIIRDDPIAVVCVCGDLGDFGLKNGKCPTNIYQATMQPKEQQEFIIDLFAPIADKITAFVPGNHEDRLTRETGIDPMLTIACRLGIEDTYRENVAITKYIFGSQEGNKGKRNAFIGVTSHGSTRNKHRKFIAGFDGADFFIAGHTHQSEYAQHGKIKIDSVHETAKHVPYKEIIVDANLDPGGYGLKKEYEIAPAHELQFLELTSFREKNQRRRNHKVMNYHAIQI